MMPARRRSGRRLAALSMLGLLAGVAFFTLVPAVPYAPICVPGPRDDYLEGPLRPEFAEQLMAALAADGFRFRRSGDQVLVTHLDIWPPFTAVSTPRRARFDSLISFQINTDRRPALNIAYGQLWAGSWPSEGRRITPPAALLRHMTEREAEYGPFPPGQDDVAARSAWSSRFQSDCALLRAAVIRMEDLPLP